MIMRKHYPFVVFVLLVSAENLLARPTTTSQQSKWTGYSFCPKNYFVDGISLIIGNNLANKENSTTPKDRLSRADFVKKAAEYYPIYGLNISCISALTDEHVYIQEFPGAEFHPDSQEYAHLNNEVVTFCTLPEKEHGNVRVFGMAVGIEKRLTDVIGGAKSLVDLGFYCNDDYKAERNQGLTRNLASVGHRWTQPDFCNWGEYLCGINVRYDVNDYSVQDVKTSCCSVFKQTFGWTNYRGAADGEVIQSLQMLSEQSILNSMRYRNATHYQTELDNPYYLDWAFCPSQSYVTGIQGQLNNKQFRLSCSDISKPKPRAKQFIQIGYEDIWEMEDEISKHVECEGVAIGFQILYEETTRQVQGVRIFCSYGTKGYDDLPYVKIIFPKVKMTNAVYSWGVPQMCKRHQTLCGFKTKSIVEQTGDPVGTEHIKAKCCLVPQIAEICAPYDDFELVVECDARLAMADTTCQYTLSEGLTKTQSITQGYKRGEDMRQSLNNEWSISNIATYKKTQETGSTLTSSNSTGKTSSNSNSEGVTSGETDISGGSATASKSASATNSEAESTGVNWAHTISKGNDKTDSKGKSESFAYSFGISEGSSQAKSQGLSENRLSTTSQGRSFSDTVADTVGSSKGSVSATTIGNTQSKSQGTSDSNSRSSSETSGRSKSSTTSGSATAGVSVSVGAEAGYSGFGFSASVKTNVETSFSATLSHSREGSEHSSETTSSDVSNTSNKQNTQESSNSQMTQNSSEESQTQTKSSSVDKSSQESVAVGADKSQTNTQSLNADRNNQSTNSEQTDRTLSESERKTEDQTSGGSGTANKEKSNTLSSQSGSEKSHSKQKLRNREDTTTISQAGTDESSNSFSAQSSSSNSDEKSMTKSGSYGDTRDKSFSTGYDWSRTSGHTWTVERSYQVSMTVPPGFRTRLYQVVGYCAHFQIRTNNFRRVDDVADWLREETENSDDQKVANITNTFA